MYNEFYEAWLAEVGLIEQPANPVEPVALGGSLSGHVGGAATLAATYAASYMMLRSGNPHLMAAGGAILLIPDPVIYGIGYWIFD